MSDQALPYYRTSGKFSLMFVLMLALAAALVVGCGWAYGFLCSWSGRLPVDRLALATYLALCLVIVLARLGAFAGLCWGVSRLTGATVRLGRCRNRVVALLAGLLLGSLLVGTRHLAAYGDYEKCRAAQPVPGKNVKRPPAAPAKEAPAGKLKTAWLYLQARADRCLVPVPAPKDAYSKNAHAVGWLLYLIYLAEGLLLVICGTAGAVRTVGEPYDEKARRWLKRERLAEIPVSAEEESRLAGATAVATLLQVPAPVKPPEQPQYTITYELYRAADPLAPSYIGVAVSEWREDVERGATRQPDLTLHDQVLVTPEQLARLFDALRPSGRAGLRDGPCGGTVSE